MRTLGRIAVCLLAAICLLGACAVSAEEIADGNFAVFGSYEQDNDDSDGTEPIEWIILAERDDSVLLLSRYALAAQPYYELYRTRYWKDCDLRVWLNGTFLQEAFSAEEQDAILLTEVDNGSSQGYAPWISSGCENTSDRIFVLSYTEAMTYFASDEERMCAPTAAAAAGGVWQSSLGQEADGTAACWWWLRSPGGHQGYYSAAVRSSGSILYTFVSSRSVGVRPAMWVSKDAVFS